MYVELEEVGRQLEAMDPRLGVQLQTLANLALGFSQAGGPCLGQGLRIRGRSLLMEIHSEDVPVFCQRVAQHYGIF